MKRLLSLLFITVFFCTALSAAVILHSPNGKICVEINLGPQLTYNVKADGQVLMNNNELALKLANGSVLGENPQLSNTKFSKINQIIRPLFPLKKAEVADNCNVVTLNFKANYSIQFRAYDDGVAYRFITRMKGLMTINDETCNLHLDPNYLVHLQLNSSFHTSCEQPYQHKTPSQIQQQDGVANLPLLIDTRKGYKIFVSEGGQWDYPGMFFKGNGTNVLSSTTPVCPEKNYIACTEGTRSLPWRYFIITRNDGELLECNMTARLADKCKLDDTSWIQPGQVSWDWWNGQDCYGPDVDFKSGVNIPTYKYFIDFASKYHIPYIIIDAGWSTSEDNPMEVKKDMDIPELVRYGKEKSVGVILWAHSAGIMKHPEAIAHYGQMGIKGLKIDFMDRSDQEIVNFYERTAAEAAKYHMVIDYHGAYKPAGLEYVYPNILAHEGVLGMEQEGNCKPDNTLYEMFIRNVAGPMDYTPGAMISMQPEVFHGSRPNNASIGTRAYQMALYIVMESGIQMLSDTPSNYYRNPDCTDFIASVPVNWDDTHALAAEAGQYEIIAKRKGNKWFIGAVTNSSPRDIQIKLDFLETGKTYHMTSFEDGTNAATQAMHYVKKLRDVKCGDNITIHMVRNGGFAASLE